MFGIEKKKKSLENSSENPGNVSARVEDVNPEAKDPDFFSRLINGLSHTRGRLSGGIQALVFGKKTIDASFLEDIETHLLSADVGIEASDQILSLIHI